MAVERVAAAFCSCSLRRASATFICDESACASAKGFCRVSLQVSIVIMDLRITHERYSSNSNPALNGTLDFPNARDIDKPLSQKLPLRRFVNTL